MSQNPNYHFRRSIRLKGYDYSQEGMYFITICVQDRACLFGKIVQPVGAYPCGRPFNDGGRPNGDDVRPNNDDFLPYGQPQGHAPTGVKRKTVGDMMYAFKSITTVEYIRGVRANGWMPFNGKLWQRNYYEHIIRDYDSFIRITQYIEDNPKNLKEDKFNL
jgi:putative transposase